ncbi:MAG: zinc ribbon domain-containing protein [Candidatus Lokiarchaeota archaeon]|nr:zinc ribbon domain-containing protein [Candidatus Lokiarchaeota archaeon]
MKTQIGVLSTVIQPRIARPRAAPRGVVTHVAQAAAGQDPTTTRNLKAIQVLGIVIVAVAVVAIVLKYASGEIEAGSLAGGIEAVIEFAGSIIPAAVLLFFATFLKRHSGGDITLRLVFSLILVPASGIGTAASAYLATTSLLMIETYPILLLLPGGGMSGQWLAAVVASAVIQYIVMALYIASLPASIRTLQVAVEDYKTAHPMRYWNERDAPAASIIPSRHAGVTSNFCRRCGTLNDPQARFCSSCGGSIY